MLHRNCLQKHIIKGKVAGRTDMMERQGIRRKQLLGDFKEMRGY